ncbi:MAG: TVP38/TMEM64 family protein [Bacillota bacterium]|uniref:TVP38/TMEM64 family membrane protein n=1 Tax=Virgibacillus salarius TaxID=447199 RepID=A0A941DYW4_9BACI|nr:MULTISPECIES: VTT domain-containing protein [Bacillaceae]NAZ10616.1 TVP38/TMEM64 family protein [Agaribacter marinus]MBR7797906.1 TVP38/TMEM64 family protein [Virgibacillus salarius]MCC2251864.1 VTT domain-containing protein [Virgibacillus sp. AGTR]MDY7046159.1 VTT domain-containing protein [Virgibacillus sp. M23]QRZ17656.1 TVP38/TMEM64 family protein [Virgibacillus sp. AGTR]
MEGFGNYLMAVMETGGLFAPLLFISFHLLRPLFFLPVVFICISGGILFGAVAGTLYSLIGITLSSILFYFIVNKMPKSIKKFMKLKSKIVGQRSAFTTSQIALLRLIPFIHFHLLSLCLLEVSAGFKDYTKSSLLSNIPLAFVYTSIGQWISNLTPLYIFVFLVVLLPFLYLLRRKEIIIKWQEFFPVHTKESI